MSFISDSEHVQKELALAIDNITKFTEIMVVMSKENANLKALVSELESKQQNNFVERMADLHALNQKYRQELEQEYEQKIYVLDQQRQELEHQRQKLDQQRQELDAQTQKLDQQRQELDAQTQKLDQQRQELEQTRAVELARAERVRIDEQIRIAEHPRIAELIRTTNFCMVTQNYLPTTYTHNGKIKNVKVFPIYFSQKSVILFDIMTTETIIIHKCTNIPQLNIPQTINTANDMLYHLINNRNKIHYEEQQLWDVIWKTTTYLITHDINRGPISSTQYLSLNLDPDYINFLKQTTLMIKMPQHEMLLLFKFLHVVCGATIRVYTDWLGPSHKHLFPKINAISIKEINQDIIDCMINSY